MESDYYLYNNSNFIILFPAKILLFGEHTVIKGSQALAMPLNDFYGTWKYASDTTNVQELQQQLPSFKRYLENVGLEKLIDIQAFAAALAQNLYFDANIPTGYGMGSSGALCAGILHQFKKENTPSDLLELKALFAKMESFFHGASSGTDPLVSYLNHPILLGENIQKITFLKEQKKGKGKLFLLDTGVKRTASPFIKGFLERCEKKWYEQRCIAELVPLVDDAIHTFLHGQWPLLFSTLHELSLFQYRYFDFMILEEFKAVWLKGLSSRHFKLKICGAGGGGFLLGISTNFEQTKAALKAYSLLPIYTF